MRMETFVLNEERQVTLTAYLQEVGGEYRTVTRRPGILILPGGGYSFCSDREADPVAFPFLKAGYDAFILHYSVKEAAKWPQPLKDYDQAMEFMLAHAKEWHLLPDKIAVIGFSAGGHLAGAAATMADHRPAAAILGYPVLNEDVKGCLDSAPSVIPYVDEKTCPCFIFATRTDTVVPIQNTIDMAAALNRSGISFEIHIYAYGPHGFSTADHSVQNRNTIIADRVKNWVEDSIGWLRDMLGDFGDGGMTKPVCKPHVTDDGEAWLSLDCTISRLFGNPEARKILAPVIAQMKEKIEPFAPELTFEAMMQILGNMKLRDLLSEREIAVADFDRLDEQLGKVPNI
jgi:acetyl esterase/lipase